MEKINDVLKKLNDIENQLKIINEALGINKNNQEIQCRHPYVGNNGFCQECGNLIYIPHDDDVKSLIKRVVDNFNQQE